MLRQGEFYCLGFQSATAGDAVEILDDSYRWWDQVKCFMELRRYFSDQPWWYDFYKWVPKSVVWTACTLNIFFGSKVGWKRWSDRPKGRK